MATQENNIHGRINHRANMVNKYACYGGYNLTSLFERSLNNDFKPMHSDLYRFTFSNRSRDKVYYN